MAYTTSLTKSTQGQVLTFEEDILFNGVRVTGVKVTLTPLVADANKLWQFTVTGNVADATHVRQDIDLKYNGQLVGHATVTAQPDAEAPSGHVSGLLINFTQPVPVAVSSQLG